MMYEHIFFLLLLALDVPF